VTTVGFSCTGVSNDPVTVTTTGVYNNDPVTGVSDEPVNVTTTGVSNDPVTGVSDEPVNVTTTFVLSGSVDDYGAAEKASIKAVLADEAGVAPSAVQLALNSGSVVVTAEILVADATAAETAIDTLTGSGGVLASSSNLEAALTSAFTHAGLSTSVTVEEITTAPVVEEDGVVLDNDGSHSGGCGTGCIGGIVGGSFVPVLLLILWLSGAFGKKCPSPCKSDVSDAAKTTQPDAV